MTTFTDQEKQLIIDALATVSPVGGGSAPFTLLRRLMGEWQMEGNLENQVGYCMNIVNDYKESMGDE